MQSVWQQTLIDAKIMRRFDSYLSHKLFINNIYKGNLMSKYNFHGVLDTLPVYIQIDNLNLWLSKLIKPNDIVFAFYDNGHSFYRVRRSDITWLDIREAT